MDIQARPTKGWNPAEDRGVIRLVKEHGPDQWAAVAEGLNNGRNEKQCRERWLNHLDPSINKGAWTAEEDATILKSQQALGDQWDEIAKLLPGRPGHAVKNRWNSSGHKNNRQANAQQKKATRVLFAADQAAGGETHTHNSQLRQQQLAVQSHQGDRALPAPAVPARQQRHGPISRLCRNVARRGRRWYFQFRLVLALLSIVTVAVNNMYCALQPELDASTKGACTAQNRWAIAAYYVVGLRRWGFEELRGATWELWDRERRDGNYERTHLRMKLSMLWCCRMIGLYYIVYFLVINHHIVPGCLICCVPRNLLTLFFEDILKSWDGFCGFLNAQSNFMNGNTGGDARDLAGAAGVECPGFGGAALQELGRLELRGI